MHKEVRYTGVEFDQAQWTPNQPSSTLTRHYGDCKDKAALLVVLLRAAGISAHLVLLNAGQGPDINGSFPGLNRFNHAIAYVPGENGGPATWIDATANYTRVGDLPYGDTGRLALVIAPQTTSLLRTPEAESANSTLTETRDFTLPGYGLARVVETSETTGSIDSSFRSMYGQTLDEKQKKDLTNYARTAYLSREAPLVEHTDGSDLQKPFRLTLTTENIHRARTSLMDGVVVLFPTLPLNQLPAWFGREPEIPTTPDQRTERDRAVAARSSSYQFQPYRAEQRVLIHVTTDFIVQSLPEDKTTKLGSGSFQESYKVLNPQTIEARFQFDSGKGQLTAEEALAMQDAVLTIYKRGPVSITFDERGLKLLKENKPHDAAHFEETAMQQQPKAALPHMHLSRVLLAAGLGDDAQQEAVLATQLEPQSDITFLNLGWMQEHNSLAIRHAAGFQRDAAMRAYRQSVRLSKDAEDSLYELAILEEFDHRGVRYVDKEGMQAAIADYRKLIKDYPDSTNLQQYRDNMLFDLLLTKQFDSMDTELQNSPANAARGSIAVAAGAVRHGSIAAISIAQAQGDRNLALSGGANLLLRMQHYKEAADLLQEAMQSQGNANASASQLNVIRALQMSSTEVIPLSEPTAPPRAYMAMVASGSPTQEWIGTLMTRHAFLSEAAWQRNVQKNMQIVGMDKRFAANSNLPESAMRDFTLGNLKFSVAGEDSLGYSVTMQGLGSPARNFWVVRDGGNLQIGCRPER